MTVSTIRLVLPFVLAAAFSFQAAAKSAGSIDGDGHSGDMARVLGIDLGNQGAKQRIERLTDVFAKSIDGGADNLYAKIREIAPDFSWHQAGHRIFFHWGMNVDPKRSEVLAASVKEAAKGNKNLEDMIWLLIIDEQRARNTAMFEAVSSVYFNIKGDGRPAPFTHEDIRGIASLLYDTHIIGDHITGKAATQRSIANLSLVKGDVIKAVEGIAARDKDFNENKLRNRLRKDLSAVSSGNDAEQAKRVLEIMTEQIPVILQKCPRVGRALGVKGV